jgi:DNA modification methylase
MGNRIERIGSATLYLGDCLELLPGLSGFDAVIMDPPYAIPTQVASNRVAVRSVGDLSLIEATFRVVFNAVADALRPGGRAFCFCDGASYPVVYRAAYNRFSLACLVWDKGRIGMGREFRKSHELILHCWTGETPVFSDGVGRPDVFRFAPIGEGREHPAEKPIALINHLLTVCQGRIADPFMGGGVVGAAAVSRGHEFVGIEIEPKYFDAACRRIEAAHKQRDLLAPIEAEDRVDLKIAQMRLAEIENHPARIISGAALQERMDDWLKDPGE